MIRLRDPERIDRIIAKLTILWRRDPDLRLGQLVSNLKGLGVQDVFYWEDEDLEQAINDVLDGRIRWTATRGRP